jgi:hypothetical protein
MKKEYAAPVKAPVVVEKKAPMPSAKVYTAPVVAATKAPKPEAKLSAAPAVAPPVVADDKTTPVSGAKLYTAHQG